MTKEILEAFVVFTAIDGDNKINAHRYTMKNNTVHITTFYDKRGEMKITLEGIVDLHEIVKDIEQFESKV